jgi:hypothetical protein
MLDIAMETTETNTSKVPIAAKVDPGVIRRDRAVPYRRGPEPFEHDRKTSKNPPSGAGSSRRPGIGGFRVGKFLKIADVQWIRSSGSGG